MFVSGSKETVSKIGLGSLKKDRTEMNEFTVLITHQLKLNLYLLPTMEAWKNYVIGIQDADSCQCVVNCTDPFGICQSSRSIPRLEGFLAGFSVLSFESKNS